jgi:CelD/BcsL family acetyltransferase involved in cellulose biosynthesis
LEIDVLRPQYLPAEMVERWRAIQAADPSLDSPFLTPGWARAVDRAHEGPDSGLKVAVMHSGGRARGFLAVRAGTYTAMPAGAPMCDYQGIVAEPGLAIDARKLVQALGVGRLDFTQMLASQASFAPFAKGFDESLVVDVSRGYSAYAAERRDAGCGALKDLDKKRRRLVKEEGAPVFTAFSRSKTDFDQLIAWKRGQWRATGQTDVLGVGWTQRLLRDLFASRDPDFGAVLFTLHIGDRLAAAHLHLRGSSVIHAWMIAHDPEFERHSPGLLLFQNILRWMDTSPYSRLDLGPGDYRFKRELANDAVRVAHGFVGVPSPAAFVRGAAYQLREVAESMKLGRVSALPGKAMRRLDVVRGLR